MVKKINIILAVLLLSLISCGNKKEVKTNPVPVLKETAKNEVLEVKTDQKENDGASPEQLAEAKKIIAAATTEKMAKFDAKKSFKNYCAICHGFKGNMMVNGAKDLTKSQISLEESVAQVYFGKGLMTPFKGVMKDEEIVGVAKYIETLRR